MPVYQLAQAQIKGVLRPAGWDDGWKNAKALASSQPIWVTVMGDSIAGGIGSTSVETKSWFGLMRLGLISRLGGPSCDFYPAYQWSAAAASPGPGTMPWSGLLNGATVTVSIIDAWTKTHWTGIFANYVQKFTAPYACTSMDFVYYDFSAGTFKIVVDELAAGTSFSYAFVSGGVTGSTQTGTTGTDITVTTTGDGTIPNSEVKKVKIFGLASGVHTLSYGKSDTANICRPMGVSIYSGNNGIGFGRLQYSGALAEDYATTRPADRHILLQGTNPQKDDPTHNTNTGFGFPMQPNLLIYALGLNDCTNFTQPAGYGGSANTLSTNNGGGSGSTMQFMLTRLVAAVNRGGYPNTSVIILAPNFPPPWNTDITWTGLNPFGNGYYWDNYLAFMRTFAETHGCAFINMDVRWKSNAGAMGFLGSGGTTVHPLDPGCADITNNCILPIL